MPRLAGTVVGATLGAALSPWLHPGATGITLSILAAIVLSHFLRLHDAAKVAGYVCGIVVLDHGANPWSYALYRLIETVVGIGVAIFVSVVPKLIPTDRPNLPAA